MVNDKGSSMPCGLYIGEISSEQSSGTQLPYVSTAINVDVVDLLSEVTLTFKFINPGDLPVKSTFVFPLDHLGLLCDVEATVNEEKRLAEDVDKEAYKSVLQQRGTHLIKLGEIPPNTQVTIKCTYISISNLVGDAIKFILPVHLLPSRAAEQGASQRVLLSITVYDKFISVTSPTHPESVKEPLILAGGTKANAEVSTQGPLLTDLVLLIRAHNLSAPRGWTSAGTSGTLPSRMNMFVLCPPFRELEGTSKEGEVVLFFDVREGDQASVEQVLATSLEKVPKWANFNVWASFDDGSKFTPIFESGAVVATEENFQIATAKIKSYIPFTGDDETLQSCLQSILNKGSSTNTRTLYFVTSMESRFDDILKLIISNSATTRGIVVSLQSKWKESSLPLLLSLNGGHVVQSNLQALSSLLPTLIETYTQPTQSLTVTHSLRPVHQFPQTAQQYYHNTANISFMAFFEHLSNAGEGEVRGADRNGDKIHQIVRPKEVSSQVLHRLLSYILLSEQKEGLHQSITPSQVDSLETILYSRFEYKLMTPKGESGGRLNSLTDKTQSVSSAIASFRGGAKMPAKAKTMPENLSDIRGARLFAYNSIKAKHDVSEVDHIERLKINFSELEPQALEFGLEYIKETLAPARQLTSADSTSLRNIILSTIADTSTICPDGQAGGVFLSKLNPLILSALKDIWKPEDDALPPWFETHVHTDKGSRSYMEDQNCVLEAAHSLLGLSSQPPLAFFGVFDGHSGRHAAEFAKVNLPFNVLRNSNFDTEKLLKRENDVITEGYVKTDSDFLAVAEKDDYKSGTTAVTLLLTDSHMVVSNVGDSEAILSRGGQAVQLSVLHKPLNEKEKQRVTEAGGTIVHYGTLRVNGVLAVTRSIGDRALKAHVPANPDTAVERITEKDEFIILASDGLWEVMKYQEVVDFVHAERAGASAANVAQKVVDEALRKDSKDNITVIIVFFKQGDKMVE
jgi:serine/threonine protein phosphatase PrpC